MNSDFLNLTDNDTQKRQIRSDLKDSTLYFTKKAPKNENDLDDLVC